MSLSPPLVTIVLPVRNGAPYLESAIQSVIAQTESRWKLIVVDNASDDTSVAVARAAAARDERITVIERPRNVGSCENFNTLLEVADTPYVKWLAADDVCGPTFLRDCMDLLEADPAVVSAHPRSCFIDADGTIREEHANVDFDYVDIDPVSRFSTVLHHDATVFAVYGVHRRDVLERCGGFGRFYGSDKVLVAALALRGPLKMTDTHQLAYRCHRGQTLFLSTAEAHALAIGSSLRPGMRVAELLATLRGYVGVAVGAPLPLRDRLRLVASIARYIRSGDGRQRRHDTREIMRSIAAI